MTNFTEQRGESSHLGSIDIQNHNNRRHPRDQAVRSDLDGGGPEMSARLRAVFFLDTRTLSTLTRAAGMTWFLNVDTP